ncbi:MAG: BirA family transcriptional regulator [Pyrinomonadaceae bacterium]|jgi:BirA family biotin operon repressor/biotin-[acetyl-CoA-carboxylase] ligase|nr:BirA family transcriptional regulator [Pyrinomonadaceae bacterium]
MLTPHILHFNSLPSTNLEAATRAAAGAAEGLCVVAGEQTAGRGRRQRQWVSPAGAGLYFSIILRPQFDQSLWPLLTLMAAVAAHDALLTTCSLETDIKWPNDILVDEKKVCGILAETVETPSGRAVVIGIGINLTQNAFPTELETIATSVEAATGVAPELTNLLESLVRELTTHYDVLNQPGGNAEIIRAWCMRSSYCEGKVIRAAEGTETLVGTTRGLERDGALRVETDDGEIRVLRAGDVSSVRPH